MVKMTIDQYIEEKKRMVEGENQNVDLVLKAIKQASEISEDFPGIAPGFNDPKTFEEWEEKFFNVKNTIDNHQVKV
jgi:hypothetical protein